MATVVDRRITWAVDYLQRHLADTLRIPELAALVNLSPSRFRDLFRAQLGVGPAEYLQRLRLRRARLLIEGTFLSVKEVMALVGYNDASHFSREFRRQHGISPSAVRGRAQRGGNAPAPASSVKSPTNKRIRQPRAREPGRRCA